ncbi:MAG: DNA polymerase III subunit beta [Candidatus Omnitrophota bacterium]
MMRCKSSKDILLKGIQSVNNIITARSTLPILSNILIEVQDNSMRLTATDLDVGISCVIPVDVQEPGAITIPAKRFNDIIKELPSEDAQINAKKNNLVVIDADVCQFKIMGLPREEFPKLPDFKDKEVIKLKQGGLKQLLNLTSFAVSSDETRYILNGILIKINKNTITLVATDGKRLAIAEKKLSQTVNKDICVIVPLKAVRELDRNLQEDGELSLILGTNQIMFELDNVTIVSRLIEGEFPDYRQVIPSPSDNKIKVDREQLLLATKRSALLSTPDYQAVKFEIFKNKLVISKSTPDVGESREEVPVEYQGKELVIGFNPAYLIDVLRNLTNQCVELEITDAEKPGVIRIDGYVYIVLPMRLS